MAGVRLEFAQFGHFDYFNIFRNSVSTAIENLEQPIGTSSTMYYEDLTTEPNNDYYYRIGAVRDSIEEFSEEIYIRAAVGDEYFSNVVMISNMSAAISDSLINDVKEHIFTLRAGSAFIIDDSNACDGKALFADGGVQSATSNDWNFDGKFTIEMRFKFESHQMYGGILCCASPDVNWKGWNLLFNGNTNVLALELNQTFQLFSNITITANVYYDIAFDRDENNIVRLYVNGNVVAQGTYSGAINTAGSVLLLGLERTFAYKTVATYDAIRITKGVARYAGAYVPMNKPYFEF